MTDTQPAESVSDERLASLIANKNLWYGRAVNDHDDIGAALRELQRLRATQRESGGESVSVPAVKLLELRAALVDGSVAEAYHVLYSIVSPRFDKREPWAEIEALSASQRKECEVCGGTGQVPHQSTSRFDVTPANELVPWEMRSTCQYCAGTGQRKETP